MINHADLMQHIVELEISLHQPALPRDEKILEQLLHSEFAEIGRSGKLYNRNDIVVALLGETEQLKIEAENFALSKISENEVILTYQSFELTEGNVKVRRTLRSSIWQRSERYGWQVRFHQGTPIKE
ncbi:DUF4440 domain-containing protein [Rouxiella sp. Mn2063]|uniref:nuclear transport factor 2 family protein n=1 Tax=Rouxiella sp. Mn2063 TaxID=3395262 RepID=UPI003BD842AF